MLRNLQSYGDIYTVTQGYNRFKNQVVTWLSVADLLVHERLREHRLVDLIVSVAAVAHDVDHHVLMEGSAPLGGDVAHVHHRLGVIAVHVEDRGVHYTSDICGSS